MYSMDISIFGYKIGVEILILMGIIYLILASHTLCGCGDFYSLIEGNTTMGNDSTIGTGDMAKKVQEQVKQIASKINLPAQGGNTTSVQSAKSKDVAGNKNGKKEGFTGANINYGESSIYNLNNSPIDTSSWNSQNMTVIPGQPLSAGVKAFMARQPQPIPLPEGEMLMFANTPFKPECCPNTYSNSSGCACMTGNQYNYLITRGSNNVPYSEY